MRKIACKEKGFICVKAWPHYAFADWRKLRCHVDVWVHHVSENVKAWSYPVDTWPYHVFDLDDTVFLAHRGFVYYNYNAEYEKEDMAYDSRH